MKILILMLLILGSLSVHAGNDGRGGGDVVVCRTEEDTRYYVLDYYLWEQSPTIEYPYNNGKFNSLSQIIERLKVLVPKRGQELEDFVNSSPYPIGQPLSLNWKALNSVRNIKDERLHWDPKVSRGKMIKKLISSNCSLKQAVVKKQTDGVEFEYSAALMRMLAQDEVQLSHILIHEWLRTYFSRSGGIRRANAFLHHEVFLQKDYHTMAHALCHDTHKNFSQTFCKE